MHCDDKPPAGVDFDREGPRIGPDRLLEKSDRGYQPRPVRELVNSLGARAPHIVECPWLEEGLKQIATAMNAGDFALAAIATCQLSSDALRARERVRLSKASPDDPKHPGYPAGEPDGKGGQFRPKDMSTASFASQEQKVRRLAQRRSVRAALKRVLSAKRLLRLLRENAAAALTEEVPGVDVLMTAAAIEDDLALIKELKDVIAGTDAALDLAEQGAVDLEDLHVSSDELSFDSFEAFKKIELQRQFGSAGDGLDYHHLAEQGPNSGLIAQTDLQSTENIIQLPQLIHEEVNSYYSTQQWLDGQFQTPRNYLQGKSFQEQRVFGLDTLRSIGVVK